uniref:C-type isolectin Sp-CL4-like n=1 Tax=Doryrhamphus excisus TaxID=161450 RepID=UPI0025ADBF47|nr:C-type isolectin Sp-CL4-like [Doryrhamphus excisus]
MPSAVTIVLLMGALTVDSAFAQLGNNESLSADSGEHQTEYDKEELRTMCSNMELEECESDVDGIFRLNDISCVKVLTMEKDFANAEMVCQALGGDVVKVQNEEEHRKLLCMMLRLFPRRLHYWIGAERGADDGFHWSDGSGPVRFAPWSEGQPDRSNNDEHCVMMNFGTWGPWNDISCDAMASVACQMAM